MKTCFTLLTVILFGSAAENSFAQFRLNGKNALQTIEDDSLGSRMTLEQLKGTKENRQKERDEQPILAVEPAAEPIPALKYRFRPLPWECNPTTAQLHYSRALATFLEMPAEFRLRWQSAEWLEPDHPDGPADEELAEAMQSLEFIFKELRGLALSDDLSWDHRLRDLRGSDVYTYRLADVQAVRSFARLLDLRITWQLKQRDFDGAIQSIQDGLRLSEFVGNGETLIQQLVGIACAAIMRENIKEAIATPGCPNLYWALAGLAHGEDSMRDSILFEVSSIHRFLPMLTEAETGTWTESEAAAHWQAMLTELKSISGLSGWEMDGSGITLTIAGVTQSEAARTRLLSAGFSAEQLAAMPSLQIVLADASVELKRHADDAAKGHLLPLAVGTPLLNRFDQDFRVWARERTGRTVASVIGGLLFPAVRQAREAETRRVMTYNRLMTLEAIRMHAAEHNGHLPATLDDLSPVPSMPDPFSGDGFEYRVQDVDGGKLVVLRSAGPEQYLPLRELRFQFAPPE